MGYDKDKAFSYVIEHGNVMDTYKLEFILGIGRDDRVPLEYFDAYQNPDGGFAFNFKKGNPSSVATTISMITWYKDLDVAYTGSFKKAVIFLKGHQTQEGYWDENQEIGALNPPEWYMPSALTTKLWLTAQAASDLLFYAEEEYMAKKAVRFLDQYRRNDGTLEGYPITNWITFALYAQLGMNESAQKIIPYIRSNIERDTIMIAWYLDCLWKAKMEHVLADDLLDLLESMQDDSGCWKTVGEAECHPSITIDVMRILSKWGR